MALALGALVWRPTWPVRRPRLVLGVLVLVTMASVAGIVSLSPPTFRLRIDPSTEPLLPRHDPARDFYAEAVRDFGDDELYAIALECDAVFTPRCLDVIDRAGAGIARMEGVRSLTSLMDVTSFRWLESEQWIEIQPFIEKGPDDRVPSDPAELAGLRDRALADPLYRRSLVSEDGRTAAMNVRFRKMDDAAFLASGLDDAVVHVLDAELPAGMRFHVAGRPHVKVHVYRGIVRDLLLLVPIAMVVMALVGVIFFRSARAVLLPLATAVVANLWTFGAIGWLGEPLSLLTGLLAPMLLAIGSIYGVHVFARYEEEARRAGTPVEAVSRTLRHIHRPALVAGVTTIIGFAALLITDVPAVFELGVFAMLGIASATVVSLVGLPAALSLMPLPRASGSTSRVTRRLDALLARLAGTVVVRRRAIIVGWAAVTVVSTAAIPRIVVDTDYLSYFSATDPIRLDFEAVNRLLAGVVPLYVVVDGGEPGSLRDPALLEGVADLQARIERVPAVSYTLSVVDQIRPLNRAFQADDPEAFRIPETRPAVTELLFMVPKQDLSRLATVDHARANLVVRTGVVGSSAILGLADAITAEIDAQPLPGGAVANVTGNALLLSRSADGIARGQPVSILAAALAIAALVTVSLGSVRLGLVAMIPNVIPVLLFFGALGLGAAPLSLPTSLIGCMALGVAIDDTVHWLARFRAETEAGADPAAAAGEAVRRVGRPIVITSVMLVLGFLVVTGSRFATLRSFGLLSALTMTICCATDLVLLPAILSRTHTDTRTSQVDRVGRAVADG